MPIPISSNDPGAYVLRIRVRCLVRIFYSVLHHEQCFNAERIAKEAGCVRVGIAVEWAVPAGGRP